MIVKNSKKVKNCKRLTWTKEDDAYFERLWYRTWHNKNRSN